MQRTIGAGAMASGVQQPLANTHTKLICISEHMALTSLLSAAGCDPSLPKLCSAMLALCAAQSLYHIRFTPGSSFASELCGCLLEHLAFLRCTPYIHQQRYTRTASTDSTDSSGFQGRRDYPPEQGLDDWGLTPQQQESYVEQFRRILAAKNAWREDRHDYYVLRRVLRARTYDLEKATTMWMNNLKFKAEFGVDTILQDFVFQERDKFLLCYPQGYHKTDKMGRPVYIQLLGQVNIDQIRKVTTEERMIKFHIQEYERCCKVILPVCSKLAGRNIDQTFGIMDVRGIGMSHLTGEVKRLLSTIAKYDSDNYPEMLGHICIINAPSVFRMLWSMVKGMLDARTQGKIEILGTDYVPGLLKWIDKASLPDWLGGESHGSLLDDVGPWSDAEVLERLGLDLDQLRSGSYRPTTGLVSTGSMRSQSASFEGSGLPQAPSFRDTQLMPSMRRHSDVSDGYHSPINSATDLSSYRGSDLHQFGITPGPTAANGVGGRPLANGVALGVGPSSVGFAPIPEQQPTGPMVRGEGMPLHQRVANLEELLSPHKDQLSALMNANGTAGGISAAGGVSTRSAPQGSLLYRVELLEEAMNVLLATNQALLLQQQQQQRVQQELQKQVLAEQQKHKQASSRCCGCCVM